MPDTFAALRERLLHAGLRPSVASRYAAELRDHRDDIVDDLMARGVAADEARAIAMARLGGEELLAEAMLADGRARSWTGCRPWMVFLLGPALLHALLLVGLLLAAGYVATTARLSAWTGTVGALADILLVYLQPATVTTGLAILAWRQRSRPSWLLAGGAVAVLVSSVVRLRVVLPAADRGGLLIVEPVLPHTAHLAAMMTVAVACALLLRRAAARLPRPDRLPRHR